MNPYIEEVAKAALDHCPGLLYELLPGGRLQGRYYKCGSIAGGPGESTSVNLQNGKWGDFAGGPTGGNLIALYAAVKSLDFKTALRELADQYGIQPQKRVTSREQDWTVVLPISSEAYQCNEDASPKFPDGILPTSPDGYWPYLDQDFNLLFFVARVNRESQGANGKGKKDFYPISYWRHKDGHFAWRKREVPKPRPLFNLENWSDSIGKIVIVEGEKAVRATERLLPDWWATSWPGGSNAAHYADWGPIRQLGATAQVILWPDNDPAGQSAMTVVARQLGFPLHVISPDPMWPVGYDLADLEKDGWDTARAEKFISEQTTRIEPEPPPTRIEVDLDGADTWTHTQVIWQVLPQTKAQLYNAIGGPVCLKKNIFGKVQTERLTTDTMKSFLLPHVRTMRHMSHGRVDYPISDALAGALLFDCNGNVPAIEGVHHSPIFLKDGSLIDTTGYHRSARSWVQMPSNYDHGMEIEKAWEIWEDLLYDFRFETSADKAHAMAFVLTGIVRPRIDGPTPLFRFEAPTPGTGKTILCRLLSEVLTPYIALMSLSDSEEETRKAITSALMKYPAVTVFDNVQRLSASCLEAALTADNWKDRILGESKDIEIPIRTVWAATLNNPSLSRSMFRRTVRIRMNTGLANPEKRDPHTFRHSDVLSYARRSRGLLLSALVSMVEFARESELGKTPVLGSYESWVSVMTPILRENGFSGFLENIEDDRTLTESGETVGLTDFIHEWWDSHRDDWVNCKILTETASRVHSLDLKRLPDGRLSPTSLGKFLSKNRGNVIDGLTIEGPRAVSGISTYKLKGTPQWEAEEKPQESSDQDNEQLFRQNY